MVYTKLDVSENHFYAMDLHKLTLTYTVVDSIGMNVNAQVTSSLKLCLRCRTREMIESDYPFFLLFFKKMFTLFYCKTVITILIYIFPIRKV